MIIVLAQSPLPKNHSDAQFSPNAWILHSCMVIKFEIIGGTSYLSTLQDLTVTILHIVF